VDRRLIQHFDLPLLAITLVLGVVGLATLYAAVLTPGSEGLPPTVVKQWLYMAVGLAVALACTLIDYRVLLNLAYPIYGGLLLLLVLVLVIGHVGGGSQRWIDLGILRLQPSEFGKLALVLVLSRFLHERVRSDGLGLGDVVATGCVVAPAWILIFLEPDLGTSILYGAIACTFLLFAGIRTRLLVVLALACALLAPIGVFVGYRFVLDDYQRDRVVTFLNPEADPHGKGYQTIQSRYAIGSGRLTGKGFGRGTQAQLRFLPEQHTDFIFSVYAEERGFLGSMLLLLLYGSWLGMGLNVARRAKERFGALLAFGLVTVLAWQVVINLGGVLGLMPVTGVTLPLMSYGGSSVLTVMACVGLLLNISMRRYMF
jgi:rod shape determining protein RodA